jgi:hypothetical protein
LGSAFLFCWVFSAPAGAQEYKAEAVELAPPQELSAAVRESLTMQAIRVVGPEGPLCEIWLRKVVPRRAAPSPELGVAYPDLAEGTLVGAVRFPTGGKDYKRLRVAPGVYTMRYALHPVDGNHLGVSLFRDFFLLAPAGADTSPASVTGDDLLRLGRAASGSSHPSVWSLVEVEESGDALPRMAHREEEGHWCVYFRLTWAEPGGPTSEKVFALVVVGSAPEA